MSDELVMAEYDPNGEPVPCLWCPHTTAVHINEYENEIKPCFHIRCLEFGCDCDHRIAIEFSTHASSR